MLIECSLNARHFAEHLCAHDLIWSSHQPCEARYKDHPCLRAVAQQFPQQNPTSKSYYEELLGLENRQLWQTDSHNNDLQMFEWMLYGRVISTSGDGIREVKGASYKENIQGETDVYGYNAMECLEKQFKHWMETE